VEVPALPERMRSAYLRLYRYQRPTLGVAAGVCMTGEIMEDVRLAVGCIGPKAERLTELETKIKGTKINEAKRMVTGQKEYLGGLLRPVDDLLGSAEYKLYMTGVMLGDALERAVGSNGVVR
jgi:CO/xanthine dehydrogenase FAD-binding subunit